jgi:hypothetical protein
MSRLASILAAVLVMAACGDSTGPAAGTSVSLTFASDVPSGPALAPGLAAAPARAPITDGVNTLDVTSVKVVLKRIELKSAEVADCNVEPQPAGCEDFRSDPVLVDVPVNGSTRQDVSIDLPAGTYDEVKFDIHEVTASDGAFLTANPTMANRSIVVEGTYNGDPFFFETNMSQEQTFMLVPSLVVGDGGVATNVTIRFDVSTWFVDAQGDLFDPSTASTGEPNESVAEENIQNSIKAFEDRDKDGDDADEA